MNKSAAADAPGNANYRGRIESHRLLEIVYRLLHLDVKWVSAETFSLHLRKSVNSKLSLHLKTAQNESLSHSIHLPQIIPNEVSN